VSVAERAASGKAARGDAPRSSHADWSPAAGRDPIGMLEAQARTRVPELVPIRHARMSASPFAFFRGGAMIMAADIAGTPTSGLHVQLCGDAHLSNFGGFGAPDRQLVFDINDFDETSPGPWEWDLKRLAASIGVAGRERGFSPSARAEMVRDAVHTYRTAMRDFGSRGALEVWYSRLDERALAELRDRLKGGAVDEIAKAKAKARRKDSSHAFAKLVQTVDGEPRIVADPPLIVPIEDLAGEASPQEVRETMERVVAGYRESLPIDRRRLLDQFTFVHIARKVVGVGSVGTRAFVLLFLGRDTGDPLFLQAKEAQASVLEAFAGRSPFGNQGRRVVEGQRLMQAASDILLGWVRTEETDGAQRDFYIRQLWDWKVSVDVSTLSPRQMSI
jgi:uncharacterized protein (DUF2252 family)